MTTGDMSGGNKRQHGLSAEERQFVEQLQQTGAVLQQTKYELQEKMKSGTLSDDEVIETSRTVKEITDKVQKLEIQAIAAIVDRMRANTDALNAATGNLAVELATLKRVRQLLDFATKVLGVAGKILTVV
ncbi:MAG: hypothetical protein JNM30_16365 [Rhodospirillales bacterium]|nr:hypothetical protein [Rhodospirillales bacterium]